jgi:DNA topoisomerase VI subunit A
LIFNINGHIFKGVLIPNLISLSQDIRVDALFVLIVEKEATFQRLIDDNFLNKYPAILITVRFINYSISFLNYLIIE